MRVSRLRNKLPSEVTEEWALARELNADNEGLEEADEEMEADALWANVGVDSHEQILDGLPDKPPPPPPPLPEDSFLISDEDAIFIWSPTPPSLFSESRRICDASAMAIGDCDLVERFLACSLASCWREIPLPSLESGEGLVDFNAASFDDDDEEEEVSGESFLLGILFVDFSSADSDVESVVVSKDRSLSDLEARKGFLLLP